MATHFELPTNLTPEMLIAILGDRFRCQPVSRQHVLKTYYDSFDWRLYRHDMLCEFNQSVQTPLLQLINRKTGELGASLPLIKVPAFSQQFESSKLRQKIEPVLEMRALLVVCNIKCVVYQFDIVDEEGQIKMKGTIEEYEQLNNRLSLFPVKGFNKIAHRIVDTLSNGLGLSIVDAPILIDALKLQGRKPNNYSSKLDIQLIPEMRADIACKTLFSYLLQVIKANEQGTIANTDSEFLHDFRVAVRKTRVGLSQLKNALPEDIIARYKEFFSWLGQITGETRDLDVYLLNFDDYKKQLPSDLRPGLDALHALLMVKQSQAHKKLARQLKSSRYTTLLIEWVDYLNSTSIYPIEADAKLSIKSLADQRIWKVYKQAIRQGEAIDDECPPEALHELRKICKKLRYLMEFFQHLYSEHHINKLIKRLKRLQEVLGSYQDYASQQDRLRRFSEEMRAIDTPSETTFLAIAALVQDFDQRKEKIREHFFWQFAAFKKPENHTAFKALFAPLMV
jgi:CHAD domain-containing protein